MRGLGTVDGPHAILTASSSSSRPPGASAPSEVENDPATISGEACYPWEQRLDRMLHAPEQNRRAEDARNAHALDERAAVHTGL